MGEYYDISEILKTESKWNWLYGERSNGKSYQVKLLAIKDFFENGRLFAYVRREREDIKLGAIEDYFEDIDLYKLSGGKGDCIIAYREAIYLGKRKENDKRDRVVKMGNYFCLSGARHYKSRAYPDIYHIIFEEAITSAGYLYDEPKEFEELVSTVLRKREGKVWLIGNTVSQDCPYFFYWHLNHIYKQKQGSIELYHQVDHEDGTTPVTIACEYCANSTKKGVMFFGKHKEHIDHGAWDTHEYPLIEDYFSYTHLYDLYIKFNELQWYRLELLRRDSGKLVLFVHPHGSKIPDEGRTVDKAVTAIDMFNPLKTRTFSDVTVYDAVIKEVIKDDMVIFDSDLSGENFYQMKKKGELL